MLSHLKNCHSLQLPQTMSQTKIARKKTIPREYSNLLKFLLKKKDESTCQCRGHWFDPWSGKIPHATEKQNLCDTITEALCLKPVLHKRSHCSGLSITVKTRPLTTARESLHTATKTQCSQKKKKRHISEFCKILFPLGPESFTND